MYLPHVFDALGLAEVTHDAREQPDARRLYPSLPAHDRAAGRSRHSDIECTMPVTK